MCESSTRSIDARPAGHTPGEVLAGRISYDRGELKQACVARDPITQLAQWLQEAAGCGVREPNAMGLSTADAAGRPSSRMVLLRGLDARGLVFYTSYFSRKGRELTANPYAAALFWWDPLERQVRVEGRALPLEDEESDAYFASRPRGHQLSAWASEQSEPVESREVLEGRLEDYRARFEGEAVPRPHSWGGYRLVPERAEFWQGRPNRLHDRIEFFKQGGIWSVRRLQP